MDEVFHWTFYEFEKNERGAWWYAVAGVIVALILLYAFYTGNFLFIVLTVITMVILFARHMNEPATIACELSPNQIIVGTKTYSFNDLDYFSIIRRGDGEAILYLHEARGLRNMLPIPIIDFDPESIRIFLRQFLEEDTEHESEPILDWLMRTLKL